MKTRWLAITTLMILSLFTASSVYSEEEYAPGEILVKFKSLQNEDQAIQAFRSKVAATKIKKFEINEVYQMKLQSGASVESAILNAYTDPNVIYAEPNYKININATPNDPSFSSLYGLYNIGQTGGTADSDIDAPEAWDIITDVPNNIIIAVIDTGVDYNHPDLSDNMWVNSDEIPDNGIDDDGNGYIDDYRGWDFAYGDNNPMDGHYHGTHVAGTIAAVGNNNVGITGVAWHAKIMPVKFLSDGGSGYTSDAISSVQYAVANGAKILSNSWGGGGYSQALKDAITASHNAGTLFVAAAGNSGTNNDSSPHYPSSYDVDNIIAVAATDHNDNLASFSCYGPTSVDIAAPGVSIYSTKPNNTYGNASGTSMATPHISGICALVWAQFPQYTNMQIKTRILSTVDQKSGLSGKMVSNGRANLYKALTAGSDNTPPAEINDLSITDATYKSATLLWTAVGDDNLTGTASLYDIRYSTSSINADNFSQATAVSSAPSPKQSGQQETYTVLQLSPNTTYYFAMKVLDEWGNSSGISNTVSTTTGNATILFQDKMENGLNGWMISGTDGNSGASLWHLSTKRFNSTTTSWYYGNEKNGNFDTGYRNYGTITSPVIDLSQATSAELTFNYWRSVESYSGNYDALKAEVSYNTGSTWQTLWTKNSTTTSELAWTNSGYLSLTPGSQVIIRFSFDTGDSIANGFEGVYIDDIEIVGLEPADTTPPAEIGNLAISTTGVNYIVLSWTAPGDDGSTGKALSYDIRYSSNNITSGNWSNASQIIGESAPKTAGVSETFTITGLSPATEYYFAIKSKDNAGNESVLSNIVHSTTLTPPNAVINPTELPLATLEPNQTTTKTLTISNTGGSPLEFSLTDIKVSGLNSTIVQPIEENIPQPVENQNVNAEYVPDEILVKLNPSVSGDDAINQLNSSVGAYTIKEFKEIGVYHIKLNSGLSVQNAIEQYMSDSHVVYAEPNYTAEALKTTNDPKFTQLYGLNNTGQTGGTADADIDAVEAWDYWTGADNIVVAVVDTGVDYTHEDLSANMWHNTGETPDNGIDDDGNGYVDDYYGYDFCNNDKDPYDDSSHGTHVSGTIGGVGNNSIGVTGVAWTTKIMACKFLSAGGSGTYTAAINAVIYSANMGAKISSNSWGGGGYSQALKDAIEYAKTKGQLFIAAAGNSSANSDSSPMYPAAYDCTNIVSVAAVDHNDALAYFSNYGAVSVDLGAPGVATLSSTPGNNYASYSGTSMATPHVSGACALIWSQKPEYTYAQVKDKILSTVDPISALSGKSVTGGRLNIYNAIQKETDTVPPAAIANLAVTDSTFKTVTLTWTATGDDNSTGTASLYDLRYSTSLITADNFASATQVSGEPSPAPAGSAESVTITGLTHSTTYYFAIKAADNVSNLSAVSNIVDGTTKIPTILFQDDMEAGVGNWTMQSPWTQTTESSHAGSVSCTDSPNGNYSNNLTTSLTSGIINLTKVVTASLEFWHKYDIEKNYDYGYVEVSSDNGTTWTQIKLYTGTKAAWAKETIDLSSYAGKSVSIRFKLVSDSSINYDGWYIDDVEVLGSATASGWLKPDITSGTIQPNASSTITLTYDATGLNIGNYSTQLSIATNDPDSNLISVLASLIVEVTPPSAPPVITITSPTNGTLTNSSQINVSGTIDYQYSIVTINGTPAVVNNNTYGATITLSEGQNTITVIATNSAGTSTKSITATLDTTQPAISITSPTTGLETKETSIVVSGTISDNIAVAGVTVNSQNATVNGNNYTVSGITLDEGSNTITGQATDTAGNTKTASITVTRDTTPPTVTITSPDDGITLYYSTVPISGTVDDSEATVTVNGSPVTLTNSAFSITVVLSLGTNTIPIAASDTLGNTSSRDLTLVYAAGAAIEVTPSTLLDVNLSAGQTTTQTFTITNTGDTDLVYSIGLGQTNSSSEINSASDMPTIQEGENPALPSLAEHHESRLLVKFKNGAASAEADSLNASIGAQTIKIYQEIGVQKVEIMSNMDLKEAIEAYMNSGIVDYAEPDFAVHTFVTPNDPSFSSLWGMHNTGQNGGTNDADIDAPEAWDITRGSSSVIIAVIDTGVDYTHPDIAANIWTGSNGQHGYDFYNNDSDPMDDHGHGTHVSGTIAGVGNNGVGVAGVNWTAKIMACKFLSAGGGGYTSDAIDATIYAVNNGAKVLSNSWGGGGYSQSLVDAIEYANSHNVLYVAAAGNDGDDADQYPMYPAAYSCTNIISVAALDKTDSLASFSNYGATTVDIGAPGVAIYSSLPGNSYASWSGTSMATPHVSGVAGLVLAQNSSQTDEQVKAKILSGAVHISALSGKCVTGGRLNAYNSLEIENDTTPPSSITNANISATTFQSATLTFTATGDDGNSGSAGSYDVRYSTSQITSSNFNNATQASVSATPKPAGYTESITVSGLSEQTRYYFAIKAIDNADNKSAISNIVQAITTKATVAFTDDMENGTSKWSAESPWALVTNAYKTSSHAWHDSPGGNYQNNVTTRLTSTTMDLSNFNSARLTFWHKYNLETYYDYGYAYISIDGGSSWTLLKTYNGHQNSWVQESIDIASYCGPGKTNIKIRFLLYTDYSVVYDGWYIDDVKIFGSNNPAWLSVSPSSGTLTSGQSQTVTLSYNANVIPGSYTSEAEITSNAVNDSSITLETTLTVTSPSNKAQGATAIASSEYSYQYGASNVIDGIIGAWNQGEWAADGSWDKTPWIKVLWNTPQSLNTIVIYGRPNKFDKISNAKIILSTGYSTTIGEIPPGGAPKVVQIPATEITWLQINITDANSFNPGLTEIEIYNIPSYQNKQNLALSATASASSEYSYQYRAGNTIDGVIGQWDQGEWAANGSYDKNPWLKLTWSTAQTVNKVVVYGRPNKYDSIQNAKITLSNGSVISLGEIPSGGAAKEIYFSTSQISWLEFTVLETTASNAGLTEIEVYYEPPSANDLNMAHRATVTASSEFSASYRASNTIDGVIGAWNQGEWAANGSYDKNPWLKLTWSTAQTVNKVVVYGRPNKYDSIQNAKITLSNGYSMIIGELPSGGAKKEIFFPAAQITWLEFKVLETAASNAGLTEIEVYYVQNSNSQSYVNETAVGNDEIGTTPLAGAEGLLLLSNPDSDSDGIYDRYDAFIYDSTEWEDTDGDGVGNRNDLNDDDDQIPDENDVYPLDTRKNSFKNNFVIMIKHDLSEQVPDNIALIDEILLTIPENTQEEDIKSFVSTNHGQDTLIMPIINIRPEANTIQQIDAVIETVLDNEYDGAVIDSANTTLASNLATALHNSGKRLFVRVAYSENLDLYDIEPYTDKIILITNAENAYEIENTILEARMQMPIELSTEKTIIELPINYSNNSEVEEMLSSYGVMFITNE